MPQTPPHKSSFIEPLRFILVGLGALLLLGTILIDIIMWFQGGTTLSPEMLAFYTAVLVAAGATSGAALWALAAILSLLERHTHHAHATSDTLNHLQSSMTIMDEALSTFSTPQSPAPAPAYARPVEIQTLSPLAPNAELLALLKQIRDLMLLTEPQRAELLQRQQAARTVQMTADLAAAANQVRHFMSISAWDQAARAAAQLAQKYPDAPEPRQLAEEVQRERAALESEAAERLFLDLSDATDHRQWRRASDIAAEILERHPSDRRADKLRHDLLTLRENAAAQERKEQEELFKDLLKRQRYEEAAQVARGVIDKYPLSPAAAELTRLLPRVEEFLRAEQAKRTGAVT